MNGFEDEGEEQLVFPQSDPVVLELHRLQSLLKEKNEELIIARSEIKTLRTTQVLKTKTIEELQIELTKQDDKLRFVENLLQHKNLEIRKVTDEKKEALAAQFAAESALRRVHENQKDDDPFPIEAVIIPLESEIKIYQNEIASLLENMKAMERQTKSKEAALLETEKILKSALERALIVEEIQNQNIELKRQIEICQEENKLHEKTNRQRVAEIEKLSQTIHSLEEALLSGGAAANAVRDCRRQIAELNEEKKILERELARTKVAANRVATAVANDWKGENDKVMPVKLWLQERSFFQAEMQRLKEKLAISERTAKAEALLKDKLKLRLKTLEDGLRGNHICSPKLTHSSHLLGLLSRNGGRRRNIKEQQQPHHEDEGQANQKHVQVESKIMRRSLWASKSSTKGTDDDHHSDRKGNNKNLIMDDNAELMRQADNTPRNKEGYEEEDDLVSGYLYDRLQKEVINLRKVCVQKETTIISKEEEIKMLMKKVETPMMKLNKWKPRK